METRTEYRVIAKRGDGKALVGRVRESRDEVERHAEFIAPTFHDIRIEKRTVTFSDWSEVDG